MSTLLVRADASASIGTGHVMRCLALAQAWKDAGGDVVLASIDLPPALAARFELEGMSVVHLDVVRFSDDDVKATVRLADSHGATAIVLDGYGFGATMQTACRARDRSVLVLDDNCENAPFTADFVLNQNLHATEGAYTARAEHTSLLLGPRYALLRREFVSAVPSERTRGDLRRVLITLGGADFGGLTRTVVESIVGSDWRGHVDVALGPAADAALPPHAQVTYHRNVRDMVPLMQAADLAISAAGSTCWELARLGVPMLLVVVAENQRAIASSLLDAGVARVLEAAHGEVDQTVRNQLAEICKSEGTLGAQSRRAQTLVDGAGAPRIAALLARRPSDDRKS